MAEPVFSRKRRNSPKSLALSITLRREMNNRDEKFIKKNTKND